jgi:hypothetical protein
MTTLAELKLKAAEAETRARKIANTIQKAAAQPDAGEGAPATAESIHLILEIAEKTAGLITREDADALEADANKAGDSLLRSAERGAAGLVEAGKVTSQGDLDRYICGDALPELAEIETHARERLDLLSAQSRLKAWEEAVTNLLGLVSSAS